MEAMKKFLFLLIPIIFYFFYIGNLKPLLASRAFVKKDAQKALDYNTFINHEARKVLAQKANQSDDVIFVGFATREMEKNIKERPLDVKSWILLTYLYSRIDGFEERAKWASDNALKLAPNRKDVKELNKIWDLP